MPHKPRDRCDANAIQKKVTGDAFFRHSHQVPYTVPWKRNKGDEFRLLMDLIESAPTTDEMWLVSLNSFPS
jgi:hypothetical protein